MTLDRYIVSFSKNISEIREKKTTEYQSGDTIDVFSRVNDLENIIYAVNPQTPMIIVRII